MLDFADIKRDPSARELRQLAKLTSPRILRVLAHGRTPVPGMPGPGDIFIAYAPPEATSSTWDEAKTRTEKSWTRLKSLVEKN